MHDPQISATSAGLQIDRVRLKIIRQTIITLIIVGAPAVVASLLRIDTLGFMPVMGLHVLVYVTNLVVYFNLHRLSLAFQTNYLVFVIFFVAVGGLLSFGIAGAGLFILASSCILASFLQGKLKGKCSW